MENWSAVKYQTNWSLEPVLSFCDSELATIQTDNGEQVINQSTPQADPPEMATNDANTSVARFQCHGFPTTAKISP